MAAKTPQKRPNAQDYTKWEKKLPQNLEDFMDRYLSWKGGETPEDWEVKILEDLEREIKEMIRVHWKSSSKTRKLFISMNKDDVWEDFATLVMRLTKRNLATLDPKFIPSLNEHVLDTLTKYVEEVRQEMLAIMDASYASEEEREKVVALTTGNEPEKYYFDSFRNHLIVLKEVQEEFKLKFGAIETLRQRELWVQNLVKFEQQNKAPRQSKGKQDFANWIPRFRTHASKILEIANGNALKIVEEYEKASGKTFLLLGENYVENYLNKQLEQRAKVKTNFTHMTADVLFFDNPGGGTEGNPVCGKVLDPILEELAKKAVQPLNPPKMPNCSDDLSFTFEYY